MARGIWKRLTDWDRSPVLNCFSYFRERREARIEALIKELGESQGMFENKLISNALASSGKPAIPALAEALKYGNDYARLGAARALKKIGKAAYPFLVGALGDKNPGVRSIAVRAIGEHEDVDSVPAILKALRDEDWDVRDSAATVLRQIAKVPLVLQHCVRFQVESLAEQRESKFLCQCAYNELNSIMGRCDSIEDLEIFERKLAEGVAYISRKYSKDEGLVEATMTVAEVAKNTAKKKNRLASKRDILLDNKPKPPKKGQMYRALRKRTV